MSDGQRLLRRFILAELAGAGELMTRSWNRRPRTDHEPGNSDSTPSPPELKWDYWKNHPRNNELGDVSGDIEDRRRSTYADVADDFDGRIDAAQKHIDDADSVGSLEDTLDDLDIDAYDIVADPTQFDTDVQSGDVGRVKSALGQGLRRFSRETLKSSEQNDFDTHPLMKVTSPGSP